jgi:sugar O-acyltransferase (sialic acid O-acetyltransferase NeuD family)
MKTTSVAVLGAGGFAAEIVEAAELAGWTISGLYDDDDTANGRIIMGRRCFGTSLDFEQGPKGFYVFAIGTNKVRKQLAVRLEAAGHAAIALVDPRANVSRSAEIGPGAYVGAGAFVGPQVKVGRHVIVNLGSSVAHDAVLGDWSQVCPGARVSGFGVLGEGAFMGSNAVLGPHGVMGAWARLGAASFASRAVTAGSLAVGVPARSISG